MEQAPTAIRRRPGGRSARVRAGVLAAATDVLAARGFDGLTFDEVAAHAGVHKTTVYRRWPSKADLVLDALHERSDRIIDLPDTGRLERDLLVFLRTVARNVTSPTGRALVVATLRTGPESTDATAIRHRFWGERFDRVRARLERAKGRGHLAADADIDLLVETLVSPIFFRALIRDEALDDRFFRALLRQVGIARAAGR